MCRYKNLFIKTQKLVKINVCIFLFCFYLICGIICLEFYINFNKL